MRDSVINTSASNLKTFGEFSKKDRDKIASIIEASDEDRILSPVVEDYVYFTTRALDYGDYDNWLPKDHNKYSQWEKAVNKNADLFTASVLNELIEDDNMYRYETFRKALLYKDHKSSDIALSIGLIFDVYDINSVHDDDEMHLTILAGLDSKKSPALARMLKTYPTRVATSMGCNITHSLCSICKKPAHRKSEFCNHLLHHRGGRYNGKKVAEVLQGVNFNEQSIVGSPACPSAYVIDALAEVIPGRLLKVATEQSPTNLDANEIIYIMNNIYESIKTASSREEKRRLASGLDRFIIKLESLAG